MCVFSQQNYLLWSFTKFSNFGNYWDELVKDYAHLSQPKEEDDKNANGGKETMVTVTPCKLRQKAQAHETLLNDI